MKHVPLSMRARRAAGLLWLVLPFGAFADSIDRVVTFGDSLSDAGNLFALNGQHAVPPYEVIPSAPYAVGGPSFSNGAVWVGSLAESLGVPSSSEPALQRGTSFSNYAFGGARARPNSAVPAPDLGAQVQLFFADSAGAASSESLYVVWVGANDVRDALGALAAGEGIPTALGYIDGAVQAISQNLAALAGAGATRFLVPNVPDLSITPVFRDRTEEARGAARALSGYFNLSLENMLDARQEALGVQIIRLDVASLLNGIVTAGHLFEFSNVTQSCIAVGVIADPHCPHPNRYLFWDAIHPTAKAHRFLGDAAAAAVRAHMEQASAQ